MRKYHSWRGHSAFAISARRGYVYVDWLEMDRLRSTRYGFWPSVDVGLFQRLYTAGLRPIEQFSLDENHPPYATLYAVPPALQTTSAPTTSAPRAGA